VRALEQQIYEEEETSLVMTSSGVRDTSLMQLSESIKGASTNHIMDASIPQIIDDS